MIKGFVGYNDDDGIINLWCLHSLYGLPPPQKKTYSFMWSYISMTNTEIPGSKNVYCTRQCEL